MIKAFLQYTQRKHGYNGKLSRHGQLQRPERPKREREDDEVEHDVDGGADPGLGVDVVAPALDRVVELLPEVADGLALERGRQDKGQRVGGDEPDGHEDSDAKPVQREDAQHEDEDRGLGQANGCEVEQLGNQKVLWREERENVSYGFQPPRLAINVNHLRIEPSRYQ